MLIMKRQISLLLLALFMAPVLLAQAAEQEEGKVFSLADCVSIALKKNPQILANQADIIEKQYSLDSSKKDLYPSMYFQYGYQYSPDTYAPAGIIQDYYDYSFSVEQPVYRGRSLVTGVELGQLNLELSKANMAQTQNDITLNVHQAYYNLLKTRKFEGVAKQAVSDRKAHLKDARAFYQAGLIPKNDMLQSEVQLANAEIDHLRAQNLTTMAMAQLNTLLRRPVDQEIELVDILKFEPSTISWEHVVEQAEKYRPELRQSEIVIEQADKNITLARAPYLPSVTLSANYLKQGDDLTAQDYPLGPSEVKTAQATLEWRFWAWGQRKDKEAVARYNMKKAQQNKTELLDNIILQVRDAYVSTLEAEYNINVTEKAIEQAEEDYRINESRYKAQLSTTTDVLDAQTRLSRARINYYDALYNYRISLMKLAWATGTLPL
jgi:outer membrane protein